ncbi:DUF4352 domain-containing protein [uncultured Methanoregula sp.]|uniref:DUF4352 domain-containing protein n=1 Tax=uncultured Methanoregula sp. TaxID=1005933 RepID=UPI002AAACDB8|nr:DUF4352 domain-containing protein [uncultured Methanoregula sp.]
MRVIVKSDRVAIIAGILSVLLISLALVPGCLSGEPDAGNTHSLGVPATPSPGSNMTGTPEPAVSTNIPHITPRKKLGLTVNSAVRYQTLPGFNNKAGTGIAVINVSLTNNLATQYQLSREDIYIETEKDQTLEHGGDRLSADMASKYFHFPVRINPGETKTGSIVYIVFTGTTKNNLVLKDNNQTTMARVDLNRIYTYS